jgi:hypothetical protein
MPFDNTSYDDEVLRNLRTARNSIATRYWGKLSYAHCALGHLLHAKGHFVVSTTVMSCRDSLEARYLFDQLPSLDISQAASTPYPLVGCYVEFYNDRNTTTRSDILALFDRAIAARERELGRVPA